MPNQTILALPSKFTDLEQVKYTFNILVQRIDVLLGYRSLTTEALSALQLSLQQNQIDAPVEDQLLILQQRVTALESDVSSLQSSVTSLTNAVNTILQGTAVTDPAFTAPTMSATYSQGQAQTVADGVETLSNKIVEILNVLDAAGITA